MSIRITLAVPTRQPFNLLQATQDSPGASMQDSIVAIGVDDAEIMPDEHPRQRRFKYQGAIMTVGMETGEVTWEGHPGSHSVIVTFTRHDLNRVAELRD